MVFISTAAAILFSSQDSAKLLFFCALGIVAGLWIFYNGFRLLQRRRLILDTPVSKIRSAAMGMVELSGQAAGPFTLIAPVTERACYYFRTIIWEWKQQGKNKQWVRVASECMHLPFFLDDNSATVLVDPRNAELDLHCDFQREFCDGFFTTKDEAPPNIRVLLSRHGISTTNKIKVQEFCIKPKNALFMLGTLAANPGIELTTKPIQDDDHHTLPLGEFSFSSSIHGTLRSAMSFAGSTADASDLSVSQRLFGGVSRSSTAVAEPAKAYPVPEIIRLSPEKNATAPADMTQQQKIAAALMKAGISNPAAWAAAGVDQGNGNPRSGNQASGHAVSPSLQSQGTALSAEGFEAHPAAVMTQGKNNKTFIISWRSQHEFAHSLAWKCTLMIWGGPALVLLGLYGILAVTHAI